MRISFQDLKEKFLTGGILTSIFLPLRLIFYHYVSPYWLGSFGLLTGIMVLLFYLSKKNKLGPLGHIITKQINRIAKGKLGVVAIILSTFVLYFYGNMIYGIENPPDYAVQYVRVLLYQENITSMQTVVERSLEQPEKPYDPDSILAALFMLFIPDDFGYGLYYSMNKVSEGWLLHFITVVFIQQIEVLGLVVYFRYISKPKGHEPI